MNANELSVLSLNCWGLYLVSKEREFRLRAIADAISGTKYDVVTLQEIWMWKDFEYLKTKTQSMLPFAKYFYSGALGSGLAILSRYPIVSTSYFRYTLAGRPLKVFHGDFYVGKGCASACIDHPDAGLIEVFTTHLHANYGDINEYEGHRVSECWELAGRLRASAAQGRQVIATGDFNSIPTSYNYEILKSHAFMTDSWLEVHKSDMQNDHIDPRDDTDIIQQYGITCDSPHNSWTKRKLKQKAYAKTIGDRLDYIFYLRTPQLSCIQSRVVMTEYIPGTQMSYSDHFGVHSVFAVYAKPSAPAMASADYAPQPQQLMDPRFSNLNLSMIHELLELLQRYQVATRKTANSLLAFFVFSVIVVLALCAIIIALGILTLDDNRGFFGLLLGLFTALMLVTMVVAATVCLIVGFVFGRTEQRALRQFISEVETLLMSLPSESPPSRHGSVSSETSLLDQDGGLGW